VANNGAFEYVDAPTAVRGTRGAAPWRGTR
jgi:hypothetical protein